MIKGTRFFSKRLLPFLLAAVMLLSMMPALTLPVLAEEPPAEQKVTNTTDTTVTYQGNVGTGRDPSLVVDGDTSHNDNKYFVVGNDQPQAKNETNPANPDYWIQLDLGKKYDLSKLMLYVYHGRALKNLVVLASDSSTFDTYSIIWNADKENFFGLGAGDKEQFPNATVAGDTITLATPTEAQYLDGRDFLLHGAQFLQRDRRMDCAERATEFVFQDRQPVRIFRVVFRDDL